MRCVTRRLAPWAKFCRRSAAYGTSRGLSVTQYSFWRNHMNTIEIRARGFGLSPALADHCQMRFERAIGSCAQHVRRVTIILLDINGDHGGEDKSCRAILT